MSNIKNNNFNKLDLRVSKSEYWDLLISKEKDPSISLDGSTFYNDTLIANIELNENECVDGNTLRSISTWGDAINTGVELDNIGFTGIDNGYILFDNNTITSDEFHNLVTGSSLNIASGDTRLFLTQISGNTGNYVYPLSIDTNSETRYLNLNGGFYQGFFKSNCNYSVLPDVFNNEINFEFILKPNASTPILPNTLNEKYSNNKGFFFYLGARSENKFWYEYLKKDVSSYPIFKTGETTPLSSSDNLNTNDGFNVNSQNIFDIKTDNKYLLFNRTSYGLTTRSFDPTKEYYITGETNENINLYQYMDRTSTGYTTSTRDQIPGSKKEYNVSDDIINNAIGFRIKDDGSIGYRILNETCTGYTINEEYSRINMIISDTKSFITIRIIMNKKNIFKILFYVNGKLIFISKELTGLLFKELNDRDEKQEGVPYNLSLGGGSQGLCDMIGFDDNYDTQYLLPIEQYFAGTFIGNIYKFRVYYGKTDYSKILNNYIYDLNNIPNESPYIQPTVLFWTSGDTDYSNNTAIMNKREIGDILTHIHSNIVLNYLSSSLIGYNLFYYTNSGDKIQIGTTFSVDPSGGLIPVYDFYNANIAMSGLTSLKFSIEVIDTESSVEKYETIMFDNMIFYGTRINSIPMLSNDIRELNSKKFNTETNELIINTGISNKSFIIAIPGNRMIESVIDMNIGFDISQSFINIPMFVEDAGGKLTAYNVYEMVISIPYSTNHEFKIKLTN